MSPLTFRAHRPTPPWLAGAECGADGSVCRGLRGPRRLPQMVREPGEHTLNPQPPYLGDEPVWEIAPVAVPEMRAEPKPLA